MPKRYLARETCLEPNLNLSEHSKDALVIEASINIDPPLFLLPIFTQCLYVCVISRHKLMCTYSYIYVTRTVPTDRVYQQSYKTLPVEFLPFLIFQNTFKCFSYSTFEELMKRLALWKAITKTLSWYLKELIYRGNVYNISGHVERNEIICILTITHVMQIEATLRYG